MHRGFQVAGGNPKKALRDELLCGSQLVNAKQSTDVRVLCLYQSAESDVPEHTTPAFALQVGLPHPLSGSKEYCQSAAAAAAEVRVRMGSTPSWRGTLIAAVHGGQK